MLATHTVSLRVTRVHDVPDSCQSWYTLDGVAQPDPAANKTLSALSLHFNTVANILLLVRFSSKHRWWKPSMYLSTLCFLIKTILSIVNLSLFSGRQDAHP